MAVVKEIMHGECKIHICDDYIRTDPEEIKRILDHVGVIVCEMMKEKMIKEKRKKEQEEGKSRA